MAQHLVYQQERPPSEIGYINAASGKINADIPNSQFGAEGGILKFNNRIKINYRGSDSNIFGTPSPVDLTTKGRHKRSADSESQKASLYKIYNDKQKVDMSYYFQPQSKNSSRKKKGGYRNKLKLSRRKIKAALSDMAINPMEVDEEPSLDEITKINIQSGEDIQENTQIDDHNEDSKESLKESKLNNTTEKEDTEIDKSENPEEIPIQPPSKFQQAQETEPREETKKTPEKAQINIDV